LQNRINTASFPVQKELDSFDFTAAPGISKLKILELSRGAWIDAHKNCILVGSSGTGKTHLAIACGLAACRLGKRVRFFTAASLVQKLEQAQKQFTLERFQKQLDKTDLLICDELGYLSFSRSGAELLFQVFADRYERSSTLITSNLPFSEWQQIFQGERMTAALLDRLTHHCEIFEMTGESFRFRESMKSKQGSTKSSTKRAAGEKK
jgi:DNA replication protein DnaC